MSRLYGLFSGTADAVFGTDSNCRIIFGNEAFARLVDCESSAAVQGRPCYEIVCGRREHGQESCHAGCPARRARLQREPVQDFDIVFNNVDGHDCGVNAGVIIPSRAWAPVSVICLLRPRPEILPSRTEQVDVHGEPSRPGLACALLLRLTAREQHIARLVADGLTTEQLSARLHISLATVRNHIRHIFAKIDVHSRAELVRLLYQWRLVTGRAQEKHPDGQSSVTKPPASV